MLIELHAAAAAIGTSKASAPGSHGVLRRYLNYRALRLFSDSSIRAGVTLLFRDRRG